MATDLADCWSLDDVHQAAVERLNPAIREMIDGGAGAGDAIRRNEEAFTRYALRPRALSGVADPTLATTVLGTPVTAPLMFAPSGLQGMAHADGELATVAAARKAGLVTVLSANASIPIEAITRHDASLWFQFYWGADRSALRALIERAEAAQVRALCLTIDMPTRPWLHRPMREAVAAIAHVMPAHGTSRAAHLDAQAPWDHDATLTWDDLVWLRSVTQLPLVLKGIMTGQDASRAVEHGVDAVIVSNHGGRVLERGQATIEVLPEIVDAIAGRCEIYCDGGIRTGSDIAIALALGARAVLIGRPVLWGLALAGSTGASRVADLLLGELRSVMMMLGAATPAALDHTHVLQHRG